MAIADSFKAGDAVVVRGIGVCRVTSTGGARWKLANVEDKKDVIEIKLEKLDALVRPVMSLADAVAVLETLLQKSGPPDARDWGDQYIELQAALKKGSPAQQAAILQRLYRVPSPDEMQQRALSQCEELLLPELALALKKKLGTLRSQLHKGQPAFGYQAPERDDEGAIAPLEPMPAGWETRRAFRVFSGKLAIGEYPSGAVEKALHDDVFPSLVAPCPNGEWFALFRNNDEAYEHLILTRAAAGRLDALVAKLEPLGKVPVEGGSLHVVDQEVCGDRRYRRAMEAGTPILGRGYEAGLGGDGDTAHRGRARRGRRAIASSSSIDLKTTRRKRATTNPDGGDVGRTSTASPAGPGFWKKLFGR